MNYLCPSINLVSGDEIRCTLVEGHQGDHAGRWKATGALWRWDYSAIAVSDESPDRYIDICDRKDQR